MDKNIKFEIKKFKFHQHKSPISTDNIDIIKVVLSNKISFGKKDFQYFIGYKDAKNIRPLCIFLPKMRAYRRDLYETKYMSFLIKDDELIEKYNKFWKELEIVSKKT